MSKNKSRWIDILVKAIISYGGEADLSDIYDYIEKYTNRNQVPSWPQNARQKIYEHSSDSSQLMGEDIFYSVGGIRSGRWGVRRQWLVEKGMIKPEREDLDETKKEPLLNSGKGDSSKRTWYDEIFSAIKANDGVATLSQIYDWIEKNAMDRLTTAWKTSVRKSLNDYSVSPESKWWRNLFYAVGGVENGVWAIKAEWLEEDTPSRVQKENDLKVRSEEPINSHSNDEDSKERIGHTIYQLKRNSKLSKLLKEHYSFRCQVCGKSISIENENYAEVHHIRPRNRYSGDDVWENMIVLCPNHHVEFDYGVLFLNPSNFHLVHKFDSEINGKKITVKPPHVIGREYAEFAKTHIFSH